MASIEECEPALHHLAARLHNAGPDARRKADFERTLSCRLHDPDVNFAGQLRSGTLTDIRQVDPATAAEARIRLTLSADDLLELVAGEVSMASAWATGRIKIDASVMDLFKLPHRFLIPLGPGYSGPDHPERVTPSGSPQAGHPKRVTPAGPARVRSAPARRPRRRPASVGGGPRRPRYRRRAGVHRRPGSSTRTRSASRPSSSPPVRAAASQRIGTLHGVRDAPRAAS